MLGYIDVTCVRVRACDVDNLDYLPAPPEGPSGTSSAAVAWVVGVVPAMQTEADEASSAFTAVAKAALLVKGKGGVHDRILKTVNGWEDGPAARLRRSSSRRRRQDRLR